MPSVIASTVIIKNIIDFLYKSLNILIRRIVMQIKH